MRWLQLGFLIVALLSLITALIHVPWSFDSATYRLPRCLYWVAAERWYWIGTLDGRLDYSSCGLEWQMIPLMMFTKSDRFLFLLSYLPFLLLPGLTYLGGRALGLARRPMLVWMWLLPCAYCIGLQCSGLQNDGYTANYTTACLAFSGVAIGRRNPIACIFAGLAAALLTGAKLSNLPLLLPLGVLFLTGAWKSGFFKNLAVASLPLMALASFLPLALLSIENTGVWTGDPDDQWGVRTGNPFAAVTANLIIAGNDLAQPPALIGTGLLNRVTDQIEQISPQLFLWLSESHRMFSGVKFGDLAYEGVAGAGFSIGLFLVVGIGVGGFMKEKRRRTTIDLYQKVVIVCGIIAWLVLLAELGSGHSARNAVPYLPLLLFAVSRLRPFNRFLHSKAAFPLALLGMLSILPVIMLTPARPLIPFTLLKNSGDHLAFLAGISKKYQMWETLRDDLKPMRDHLPPHEAVIGYAGAFRDTSYGLWKPYGSRVIHEIGVPVKNTAHHIKVPDYVVATGPGIQQRFGTSLEQWLQSENKEVRYSFKRSTSLESDSDSDLDEWYLLGPADEGDK